jgi:riboflavin synthase alpha subunit
MDTIVITNFGSIAIDGMSLIIGAILGGVLMFGVFFLRVK